MVQLYYNELDTELEWWVYSVVISDYRLLLSRLNTCCGIVQARGAEGRGCRHSIWPDFETKYTGTQLEGCIWWPDLDRACARACEQMDRSEFLPPPEGAPIPQKGLHHW